MGRKGMHLTEWGALLARLEHGKVGPGHYVVEGYTVRHVVRESTRRHLVNPRVNAGYRVDRWEITGALAPRPVWTQTFTQALEWIADR